MLRLFLVIQFYCLIAIYTYFGLTPHPEAIVGNFNDLLMHFVGYFVAAFSITAARPQWPWWQRALILIVYSIAIEIAQHFNPPRTFSLSDIVANSAGVLLGLVVANFILVKVPAVKGLLGNRE